MDYKKKTISAYNLNAKSFSEKFNSQMELDRPEFEMFINLVLGNKILDVGCGSGEHLIYFKNQGFDVKGIDLCEEFVRICKKKGLDVLNMDIENIHFSNQKFDGIWAVTSLLHIPKDKLGVVMERFDDILSAEGIVYICLTEGEGEYFKKDNRFFSFWDEKSFKNFFSNYFDLVFFERKVTKTNIFLQGFFKKKK